jgi:hypothetical protein
MIEDQLVETGQDLRTAARGAAFMTIGDGVADVARRSGVRRRRRRTLIAVASVTVVLAVVGATFATIGRDRQHVTTGQDGPSEEATDMIRAAIAILFEPGYSIDDKLAQVDDSNDLRDAITQGTKDPRAPRLTATVTSVDVHGSAATAHIDFFIDGAVALAGATLGMVRVGDRWVAQRQSYCNLIASSGPPCPSNAPTSTTQGLAAVMARTVPTDNPSNEHFVPTGVSLAVPDGVSGQLTAAVGVRSGTGDGGGQVVFFWHDGTFIGWNSNHQSFKLGIEAAGTASIQVTYLYLNPGEAACCATGQASVTYHWDGSQLLASGDPPHPLGPTIELTG